MLIKNKRNTIHATQQAAINKKKQRVKVLSQIINEVFSEFCTCGQCKLGNISQVCISRRDIAGSCNALGVPTLRGKVGNWSHQMVNNLITKEGGCFAQYKKKVQATETLSIEL